MNLLLKEKYFYKIDDIYYMYLIEILMRKIMQCKH